MPHHDSPNRVAALLLVLLCVGCGSDPPVDSSRTIVTGSVTFEGKPLPAADVTFEAVDVPKATVTMLTPEGTYWTDRVPIGKCRVSISTLPVQVRDASLYVKIPEKYADTATSGLTIDVKEGSNENVNFELKP